MRQAEKKKQKTSPETTPQQATLEQDMSQFQKFVQVGNLHHAEMILRRSFFYKHIVSYFINEMHNKNHFILSKVLDIFLQDRNCKIDRIEYVIQKILNLPPPRMLEHLESLTQVLERHIIISPGIINLMMSNIMTLNVIHNLRSGYCNYGGLAERKIIDPACITRFLRALLNQRLNFLNPVDQKIISEYLSE
jgi:hypothetical protein